MRINPPPIAWKAAGLLGTSIFRTWMDTVDFKWAYYDPEIDPAREDQHFILLFWHEHILCPIFVRRHSDVTMLISPHEDAEIVGQIARLVGMQCVRGSSFDDGPKAVKQLLTLKEHKILAFTPDGPRGPRRRLAPGAIFMASRLQMPIVLLGVGYDRPWRANSWDRFAIPRPFSRGRMISSPLLHVPKRLGKDDREHFRLKIEKLLNDLTFMAENWAASGDSILGESTVDMGPKCSLMYTGNHHHAVVR